MVREIEYDDIIRVDVQRATTEGVKCKRCGYEWIPKVSIPKRCTACKSPYWAFERSARREGSSAANKYGFDLIKVGEWSEFPTYTNASGEIDVEANSRFWRSLEQYMRRKGYTYSWEGTGLKFRVMRRT